MLQQRFGASKMLKVRAVGPHCMEKNQCTAAISDLVVLQTLLALAIKCSKAGDNSGGVKMMTVCLMSGSKANLSGRTPRKHKMMTSGDTGYSQINFIT